MGLGLGKPHLNWVFVDAQEVTRWTKTQSETEEQEKKVNVAGTSAE